MRLKQTSLLFSAVAVAAFSVATVASAQAPEGQQPPAGDAQAHHHEAPPPTNLKVLPKTMTGEQVHELMHKWAGELGTECTTCHATDPNRKMPNGRPAINFADDSKPEKNTARLMYQMVEDINKNYVGKLDNGGPPVSCGTCHRGHVEPPLFVAPKEDHDHDHPAPPAGGDKPGSGN
jgi:hypothetical protein